MIWEFIQNQILGMKWLNELIGNALTMMGLDIIPEWVAAFNFLFMMF